MERHETEFVNASWTTLTTQDNILQHDKNHKFNEKLIKFINYIFEWRPVGSIVEFKLD